MLNDITAPSLVTSAAREFGGDAVVVTDGETISFQDLARRIRRVTAALMASGIKRGDRVAVWAPNSAEWIIACLGLQSAGAVLVPISTRFRGDEARYILGRAGVRLLFTVDNFLGADYVDMLQRAAGGSGGERPARELPQLERIVMLGAAAKDCPGWEEFLRRGEGVSGAAVDERALSVQPDDLMDLLFTSGTTGFPKGVLMTHRQNLDTYRKLAAVVSFKRGERYLIVNPFFHAFGYKAGILCSMMAGMTMYPHAVFDAERVLTQIERDRITVFPAPPTVYQMLFDHPRFRTVDHSSLELSLTGAASVPVELVRRMQSEMSFRRIHVGYGLTEACAVGTMTRAEDTPETIATSVGTALYPELGLKIVDDDGNTLPPGQAGELMLRGMSVMKGYWDDPAATAEAIDREGWLHTGDIGVLDERGYLRILDRKKDMYIVGGFNAYPAEIENIMLQNPAISQVAVVGKPEHRLGEVGVAFVVPRPGTAPGEPELIAWCREHMANFKVPRRIVVCETLPMNAMNKVLKFELRKEAAALPLA
jgi:acyl-CoA synthetase (AMP-forming)/AMP-acid ligase II